MKLLGSGTLAGFEVAGVGLGTVFPHVVGGGGKGGHVVDGGAGIAGGGGKLHRLVLLVGVFDAAVDSATMANSATTNHSTVRPCCYCNRVAYNLRGQKQKQSLSLACGRAKCMKQSLRRFTVASIVVIEAWWPFCIACNMRILESSTATSRFVVHEVQCWPPSGTA